MFFLRFFKLSKILKKLERSDFQHSKNREKDMNRIYTTKGQM
uniref:Uncharacterized protein n=1 Tax=uncultured bacterium 2M03 TaxID=1701359 RepID=A0A0M5IIC8_9BACT|nr:hypothetical protein [uncultured bacterium 2M03]